VLVVTAPLRRGTLAVTLKAYGLVQPAPGTALNISMPRPGQILNLRVVAGQRVRTGDPLFDYASEPANRVAYEQAVSAVTLARQELAHTASLFAQKLATQSQLDQAKKAVRDAEAALALQQRLGSGEAAQRVAAPYGGVVAAVAIANGDHVQANAPILQLARDGQLDAVLGVAPENGVHLAPDMPVRLTALARPSQPVAAKIASVGGLLEPKTQLVDVVVSLPAATAATAFLAGEHVSAEIVAGQLKGWIVPRQAVLTDSNGPYVFQAANGIAHRSGVAIIGEAGDRTVIEGALDPARNIVVTGNYELSDGMAVREAAGAALPGANPAGTVER